MQLPEPVHFALTPIWSGPVTAVGGGQVGIAHLRFTGDECKAQICFQDGILHSATGVNST